MRIAITGGTGLLGTALADRLYEDNEVFLLSDSSRVEHENCVNLRADISDRHGLAKALDSARPEALVHTAALTNVDYCEDHADEARQLNVEGSANAAAYAAAKGIPIVHISTDFVFDGTKPGGMYAETDATNPLGVYSNSKLEGEKAIESSGADYAIIRNTLYGWNVRGKRNFAMLFYENMSAGKPVTAFANQYNTPMLANDIADVVAQVIAKSLSGTFHAGCADRVNRVDFAKRLAATFGFDESLVTPVELTDGMLKARRPRDVSLDSTKLEHALGRRMPTLAQGLARMRELKDEGYESRFKVVQG